MCDARVNYKLNIIVLNIYTHEMVHVRLFFKGPKGPLTFHFLSNCRLTMKEEIALRSEEMKGCAKIIIKVREWGKDE